MIEKPADKLEYFEGCLIQHGPSNDRIYLMKLGASDPERAAVSLIAKAMDNGYSKIFAKVPDSTKNAFLDHGFQVEARIPGFYNGSAGASFLGFYLAEKRAVEENRIALNGLLDLCLKHSASPVTSLPDGFFLRKCSQDDADRMAGIYSIVFPTYPFPIDDPSYLRETMEAHVRYFGIEAFGTLIALSSAEMDEEGENAEMTDFATLPDWRGYGLSIHLLRAMEDAMRAEGMKTAYTIARSLSPGMNLTFARSGYRYGGRMLNNTNISGRIESMNVWYKPLGESTTVS
ncbi:MAG: putative beta-lysine N-acetyltransferase [Syntrophorhabdaceae bacterium]|nr:putative beta-lysine N-acetyltransferase [Syntrophorhabdaceae bacterium]